MRKAVIFFRKCTTFSVPTTDTFSFSPSCTSWGKAQKQPLCWTTVRQNKSVIASKTNCFFYCPVPLFSCPRKKLCWRSPGVADHGEGEKDQGREWKREKGSANNSHLSLLPAMLLNAAISSFGQINQGSLPSALNCILSTLHYTTNRHTPTCARTH